MVSTTFSPITSQSSFISQRIREDISAISERISTGRRVNSILDNPITYSQSVNALTRIGTFNTILDGLNNSSQTLSAATSVLNNILSQLNQAESFVNQSRNALLDSTTDSNVTLSNSEQLLNDLITGDNPVAYYRLNGDALNSGSSTGIDGIVVNGVNLEADAIYSLGGEGSAQFNGTTQGIRIPDSVDINLAVQDQRTVELVFNADTTSGRQVLFEEGGGTNGLTLYIDNGQFYGTGRDAGSFNYSFSAPVVAGETYHAAFVFDNAVDNSFKVYLNGQEIGSGAVSQDFAGHSGDIGIGYAPDTARYFDGAPNARNYFQGRISDVAVYNTALSANDLADRYDSVAAIPNGYNRNYDDILADLRNISDDAYFKTQNLLQGDTLNVRLNEDNTSSLTTSVVDVSQEALNLLNGNFYDINDLNKILFNIDEARTLVEGYLSEFTAASSVLSTRIDFTNDKISTLQGASDDLTLADTDVDQILLEAQQARLNVAEASYSLTASYLNSLANDFLVSASSNRPNSSGNFGIVV